MASLILPHTSLTATLDSMINCCSYWLHVNRIDLEVGYFLSLYSGHPIYWPLRLRLVRAIGTRISMRSPCSQRLPWLWCEQWRAPNSPTQLPHITDIPEASEQLLRCSHSKQELANSPGGVLRYRSLEVSGTQRGNRFSGGASPAPPFTESPVITTSEVHWSEFSEYSQSASNYASSHRISTTTC